MAKRSARKVTARRRSTSAAATRRPQAAKGAAAKKPARAGGSHVRFGVHGMTDIVKAVRDAGLEREFNAHLDDDHQFVRVKRTSLAKIKEFVTSRPQLAELAGRIARCDCDPGDPYCIYI